VITLKKHLGQSYAFFASVAFLVLALVINVFSSKMFEGFVRNNIAERTSEIVRSVSELYNPLQNSFNLDAVEAIGMLFMHEGYIINVVKSDGSPIWDARSMDMDHCKNILNEISLRMEGRHKIKGSVQNIKHPVQYGINTVALISIETYAPFFYNDNEDSFIVSLNKLLLFASIVFVLISILFSVILSTKISKPIVEASSAAKKIAGGDLKIRIKDDYKIKELNELSASVNEAAAELYKSEVQQKQLTSDIAHELRTPLTCLQGNIEAMIDGVWEITDEHIASCYEEVKRLTKLVEDLSLLTNLEWERLILNKTQFDVCTLINAVTEQYKTMADEKGITINTKSANLVVLADYDRLKQVLINIVSNAVKYTEHGSITIAASQSDGKTEISVSDTGIGIEREELPHIFERFYRTDKSRNRKTGGTGIGLTIAAAIIKAHNGEILAESDSGTVFRIRF
jgi:signal transduction histidine kinase